MRERMMAEPGAFILRPIEYIARMCVLVALLIMWGTIGALFCTFIAFRALLGMVGKMFVNALLGRAPSGPDHFTAAILLWPQTAIGFIRWAFGYVDPPRVDARHPLEVVLETLLLCFFMVTVIWADEVKPGYLPKFVEVWWWLWESTKAILGMVWQVIGRLLGMA